MPAGLDRDAARGANAQFLTISPTHIEKKKREAWSSCLARNCIAIGWMQTDLTGKSLSEVERIIRLNNLENQTSALLSFQRFLSLKIGDYVAVNNPQPRRQIEVTYAVYVPESGANPNGAPECDGR